MPGARTRVGAGAEPPNRWPRPTKASAHTKTVLVTLKVKLGLETLTFIRCMCAFS